ERIIGGQVASAGQFPFAAAIYTTTENGNYFCGGVVLTNQWILTAGQCVYGYIFTNQNRDSGYNISFSSVHLFTIILGTINLQEPDSSTVKVSTDFYVLHPNYNSETLDNDIGLIRLRLPVTFSIYLNKINLPSEELKAGDTASALGWGQISDEESGLSNDLNWVTLSALSNAECKITYGNQITDNMVCFSGNYNEGTCKGDTGGPLIQRAGRGWTIVVAIASFVSGNGCETTDPSGYTRIFGGGVRIIGGNLARAGQFPFAAAIYTTTSVANYFCGGTLISDQWILTAGQCVDGVHIFTIHLGANTLDGKDPYTVLATSDTYVLHPDYDRGTLDNDIGLIWLRLPVTYSGSIRITLSQLIFCRFRNYRMVLLLWLSVGDKLMMKILDNSGLVNDLRWVHVASISNTQCKITYGDQITDNMVCVTGNFNQGTCRGDSGSPLVQTISRGHSVVVGVSSFFSGNGCETTDPSGFTRMKLTIVLFLCFSSVWALSISPRIIGGDLASVEQFPYVVAMIYDTETDEKMFCGGTLLNNQWILTAAHCTDGAVIFTIYLGMTNLTVPGSILRASTYVTHPSYNSSTLENDIALVLLADPVEFTDNIKPIDSLPSEGIPASVNAVAVGWGLTSNDAGTVSNNLYYVQVTTISNSECKKIYADFVKDTMICAKGTNNEGICEGDSGGPLIQITNEGKSVLIGISSFYSASGCETEHPSGFTRTYDYIDWIKSVTGSRIGGELATPGQFPYIAGISYRTNISEEKFCGGTLLNNQWILTAACCLENNLDFRIYLGTINLEEPGLIVNSSLAVWHPHYNATSLEHNIGMLMLSEAIEFTVTTITNFECTLTYGLQIKNTMICAKDNGNEGICVGDTGGPLVHITEEGSHFLIGIASFYNGRECGTTDPSGFTRTSDYIHWIHMIMSGSSRIIGGELAAPGQYPYIVGISYKTNSNEEKFCGGTLLNNQWDSSFSNLEFKIYLGTTNLEEPGLVVDSASTVLHPDYNSVNLENNVGLLQLFEPIEFTDIIKPIDFLSTERVSDSVRATLLGWGLTSDDDGAAISSDLHHVQLTTITNSDCMLIFSNQIKNTMLCAKGDSNEGVCKVSYGTRIIGGEVAFAGQFPFMAAIYKATNDGTYFCGGALMNSQWILTAGQCVDGAVLFTIYLGTNNIKDIGTNGLKLATDNYELHPDFNASTLENDLGLIKLRMPITFTMYVRPIDYLPTYELLPGTPVVALGWGQTSDESPSIENELRFVYLAPLSDDECKFIYGNQVTNKMVCASGLYNEGFCLGDSGTPLVRFRNGPTTTHMGIATFISQNGCDSPDPSGAILFTIYLGKTNLKNDEPDSLTVATDTYILHPNFNPLTLENDIGLIKLRMPITFNKLPEIVDELHYVYQVPLSNEECRLTYGDQITESMVCAGLNYNEGFCHGDTGAPLVRYTNGPIVTHMGIASFISQNGCNTPEPSGYTRTFNYVDWIRNKTLIGKNGNTIERIIGGNIAFAGQFPYIAAIFINTDDGTYFCGGALMNHQWILTAGHCVNGAILFTIYLGTNHLESSDSTSLKLATDYYILHPDFNLETLENDIGLIKLRMSITFTDYIKPIDHLPTYELLPNAGGERIIGGTFARAGQFPFAAAIYIQTADGTYFCSGALLANQYVLTAGQCVDGGLLFTIQLGSNSLEADDPNRLRLATDTYYLHPDYNPDTLENDIGIIKFRSHITYTDYIRETAGFSAELKYVFLTTLSNEECRQFFGSQITDNMVCVAGTYNEGTC
ncbi:Trypsin domain containing protein, partial [Asbolus verrucosus]